MKKLSGACRLLTLPIVLSREALKRRFVMDHSRYRWVIVAAGGLLGCVAIGAMFSLPVLLQPISRDTGWSVTGVSSAMTIGFLAMAVRQHGLGHAVRPLRSAPVVLIGSILLAASLALASRATSLARSFSSSSACWSAARPPRSSRR